MITHCPVCYVPTDVAPSAREGRCDRCRPRREHSKPRRGSRSVLDRLAADPTWPH